MDFDNDDDSRSTNSKTKPKKSYKILPYAINNNQLKDTDLKTWKVFCQRYSDFKQQKQLNKNNSNLHLTNLIGPEMVVSKTECFLQFKFIALSAGFYVKLSMN